MSNTISKIPNGYNPYNIDKTKLKYEPNPKKEPLYQSVLPESPFGPDAIDIYEATGVSHTQGMQFKEGDRTVSEDLAQSVKNGHQEMRNAMSAYESIFGLLDQDVANLTELSDMYGGEYTELLGKAVERKVMIAEKAMEHLRFSAAAQADARKMEYRPMRMFCTDEEELAELDALMAKLAPTVKAYNQIKNLDYSALMNGEHKTLFAEIRSLLAPSIEAWQ